MTDFQKLIEELETGVFITDDQGVYQYVNPFGARLLGYSPEDLVGVHVSQMHFRQDEGRMRALFQRIQEEGLVVVPLLMKSKSGEAIPVEMTAKVHGKNMISGLVRDQRKDLASEKSMREKLSMLSAIIETLPGSLTVVDKDFKVIAINDEGLRLKVKAPLDRKQVVGSTCYQVFHRRSDPCPWCRLLQVLETGESIVETSTPDDPRLEGAYRVMKYYYAPLLDRDQNWGYIEYGVDVTELHEAKEAAEAASKAKGQFLANMSHEIRTPLNGILGFLELIKESTEDEEQLSYIRYMESSSETLLRVIEDILDSSKIEAGKLELEPMVFSFRERLDAITKPIERVAEEKGLTFRVAVAPVIEDRLTGDPVRFAQIVTNILNNAVKFTEVGGVELTVYEKSKDAQKTTLSFKISDSGIGIEEKDLHHLFEPFVQADGSSTRKFGGTGLGLMIARYLVELMGGKIEVKSKPDQGTVVSFDLTFERTEKKREPKVVTHRPVERTELKLLLAEDNDINRMFISRLLAGLGYELTMAHHGKEAVEALKKEDFDVVLMDCQMPVMDGYEATETIRASEEIKQPVIVAMTAHAMPEDEKKCKALGMDYYLSKPISIDELEELLLEIGDSLDEKTDDLIGYIMQETGFDRTSVMEILEVAEKSLGALYREGEKALMVDERDVLRKHLHQMKGAAANIRLRTVHPLVAEAEKMLEKEDMGAFFGLYRQIGEALVALKELLKEEERKKQ